MVTSEGKQAVKIEAKKATNSWLFWTLAICSVVLYKVPILGLILAPINTFATMIHELSHALVCIVTGGYVSGMTIVSDGGGHGGLTFCHAGNPLFYTPAGYLGTAVVGSLLVFLGQFPRLSKGILFLIGTAIGLASLILVGANIINTGMQGFFSLVWGLAIAGFLLWAGMKWKPSTANVLLLFLAIQTALNSFTSLVLLAEVSLGIIPTSAFSDATSMAALTHIPAAFWSVLWSVMSAALLAATLWWSYGRQLLGTRTHG